MQDKHVSDINLEVEFKDENWSTPSKPILNSAKYLEDNDLDAPDSFSLLDNGEIIRQEQWKPSSGTVFSLYNSA